MPSCSNFKLLIKSDWFELEYSMFFSWSDLRGLSQRKKNYQKANKINKQLHRLHKLVLFINTFFILKKANKNELSRFIVNIIFKI